MCIRDRLRARRFRSRALRALSFARRPWRPELHLNESATSVDYQPWARTHRPAELVGPKRHPRRTSASSRFWPKDY
eukprot:6243840-Alexandrium_andersonii.AAC.1